MTTLAKPEAMKRIAAFVAVREKMAGTDPEVITESNGVSLLMSDLRAALSSPAELGGVEPVAWTSQTSMDMLAESGTGIMSRIHTDYISIPLYTTPRAAEAVTVDNAMIERAVNACIKGRYSAYHAPETDDEWRAALTAALTPPSAKGEL